MLVACGRVGFDPSVVGDNTNNDATATTDGTSTGGDGGGDAMAPVDAFAAVCASAMVVNVGSTVALDTCGGTQNNIDTCSTGKREIVFKFVPTTTRGYTIKARDAGTQNVSNSTSRMDNACLTRMGGCTGILGTTLTAGTPYYFVVEASAGACASIEFDIQ